MGLERTNCFQNGLVLADPAGLGDYEIKRGKEGSALII
jgi:hypothetical protein